MATAIKLVVASIFLCLVVHQLGSLWCTSSSIFAIAREGSVMLDINSDHNTELILPSHGSIVPFSCNELLQQRKTNQNKIVTDVDPNKDGQHTHAQYTNTTPPFYISLHPPKFDAPRWGIWTYGFYYERLLTKNFVQVLQSSPGPTRVIDVGGNIGWFTLLSAASKDDVTIDTFEPNLKNCLRLCESLSLNRWAYTEFENAGDYRGPKVNLHTHGVSNEIGSFVFQEHETNPGQGQLQTTAKKPTIPRSSVIPIVTLDHLAQERGWFDSKPDIAILKVDVEGLEYKVVEGAAKLLQSKLVRHVFCEVSARDEEEGRLQLPFLEMMLSAGYRLYRTGGWLGPKDRVEWPHDRSMPQRIINATMVEGVAKQLNLWWTIDPNFKD